MFAAYLTVLALFGLAFGSFANVVIWRFPRGESLSSPPSHCPRCDHPVRWYDNVPVLSWLLLRGECRDCSSRISARYPLVEFSSGLLWVLAGWKFGVTPSAAAAILMFYLLLILTFIDLDTMRLPNKIVLLLAALGLVASVVSTLSGIEIVPLTPSSQGPLAIPLVGSMAGGAAGAGVSLLIAVLYQGTRGKQGFGMGDVKLLGAMGLFLGLYVLLAFFAASILGAIWGVYGMARGTGGPATRFPFGPFLAAGGIIAAVGGPAVIGWYLSVLGITV